jgi:ubiquinone/menaquinone biosynthesis C-methylase UbiE
VKQYDGDMALMHPNRAKMIEVALELLPHRTSDSLVGLELGIGTGYFTQRFLQNFPASRVMAVDGAVTMVELARMRLGELADRVQFVVGDFRSLRQLVGSTTKVDIVFSSFALHHLTADEKLEVVEQAVSLLKPGGWFVNADITVANEVDIEQRIQDIRVEGIVRRANGADPRFMDAATTRAFLDQLEAEDCDCPLTLREDLEIVRKAGVNADLFWKEYREAVYGGPVIEPQ